LIQDFKFPQRTAENVFIIREIASLKCGAIERSGHTNRSSQHHVPEDLVLASFFGGC